MSKSERRALENGARHDLGTELVPIYFDFKVQGREVHEAFCIEPSEDLYIANMAKQLCSEWQLNRNYEQAFFKMIKERIDKFKESVAQLRNKDGQEALEVIRLNFHIGQIHVKDQFLWDVADPDADPEAFAAVMCADLDLPRRFVPEIACRIREQIIELRKKERKGPSPSTAEHKSKEWTSGKLTQDLLVEAPESDKDITRPEKSQPKSIYSLPFVRKRAQWEDWGPHVRQLTDAELRQMENRNKKARIQSGHPMKANGSMLHAGRHPTSLHGVSSGGSVAPNSSKRQRARFKVMQDKQKDAVVHMPPELSTPVGMSPGGTMVPMVPPLSAQQQHNPTNPGPSIVRTSPHYSMYNGGMQNPIGNQWATSTSISRMPVGPGAPSHDYADYVHLQAMQGLQEGRSDVVMNSGMGQQANDRIQGTLGNIVGGPYQNGNMMQHLQNGHPVAQSPSNALSWVMNPSYSHLYRYGNGP